MNVADAVTQTTAITKAADDFAGLVRELRTERSLSLGGLATRAGIAKATLSRWEAGKASPRLAELDAVLDALDASDAQRRKALESISAPRAAAGLREAGRRAAGAPGVEAASAPMAGDLLRAMRLRGGRTVDDIARLLGVSARSVHAWERSEAWPTAERLRSLCYLLGAAPAEVTALTAGNAWLATLEPLPEADSPDAIERMQIYLDGLFFSQSGFDAEAEALRDIAHLALLARLVPLATRYPPAQTTLLNAYAGYATWLSGHRRFPEAGRYAERALELKQGRGKQNPEWLRAAIIRSHATVYGGKHATKTAAVRVAASLLESVLPVAAVSSEPVFEAWILSEMAEYAFVCGQADCALNYAVHACDVAARVNSTEYDLRRFDQARLLARMNRAGEALSVLPAERAAYHPPQRVAERLLRVEALLQLGNPSEAHDWLGKAYEIGHEYKLDSKNADALAQRF